MSKNTQPAASPEVEAILAAIAAKHLGIPILQMRGVDSLDFRQVCVGELHAALYKAFELGAQVGIGLAV